MLIPRKYFSLFLSNDQQVISLFYFAQAKEQKKIDLNLHPVLPGQASLFFSLCKTYSWRWSSGLVQLLFQPILIPGIFPMFLPVLQWLLKDVLSSHFFPGR